MKKFNISSALAILNNQGVIAYPTESVFGLGCDPDCDIAIQKILDLKQRAVSKGLILIANSMAQLTAYADFSTLNEMQLTAIKNSWPGNVTWILPCKKKTSPLISGNFNSVAVRVSLHPFVKQLCKAFAKPIISTSANLNGKDACINAQQVSSMFAQNKLLDKVIDVPVLGDPLPSKIINALSQKQLR
ncbi:MAG: Sua5/YciO/YrdC/YwlC family protein [Psychromonas sp.]|nr:Sua5/YciO/YrdC/YwlC family protein [Psychromonas sp.]